MDVDTLRLKQRQKSEYREEQKTFMNSYELQDIQSSRYSFESDFFRQELFEFESSTEVDIIDY